MVIYISGVRPYDFEKSGKRYMGTTIYTMMVAGEEDDAMGEIPGEVRGAPEVAKQFVKPGFYEILEGNIERKGILRIKAVKHKPQS